MEDYQKKFNMRVQVYVDSTQGDRLQISEEFTIKADGFLDVAKILSEFHNLAKAISDNRQ